MRYAPFLKENGTIGFVAPSFGCATEPYKSTFNNAIHKFEDMGYRTYLGPNCYLDKGIGISNTPEECGKELTDCYVNNKSDVIISCGGGELMCEVVNHIDFDAIAKSEPKWYMGYSDNTNFTFPSTILCDTAAIYGPCVSAFGMNDWHQSVNDAMDVLTGRATCFSGYDKWEKESLKSEENPYATYNATEESVIRTFPGDTIKMHGRLVGGCMDCLSLYVGTRFDKVREFADRYKEDGILWFMEACELNVMSIRRTLWQMDNAGWFENCSGFIFGRPMIFGQDMMGLDQYRAVTDILGKYNVPILMDADIGHLPPAMPIISGSVADVCARDGKYTIDMKLV